MATRPIIGVDEAVGAAIRGRRQAADRRVTRDEHTAHPKIRGAAGCGPSRSAGLRGLADQRAPSGSAAITRVQWLVEGMCTSANRRPCEKLPVSGGGPGGLLPGRGQRQCGSAQHALRLGRQRVRIRGGRTRVKTLRGDDLRAVARSLCCAACVGDQSAAAAPSAACTARMLDPSTPEVRSPGPSGPDGSSPRSGRVRSAARTCPLMCPSCHRISASPPYRVEASPTAFTA